MTFHNRLLIIVTIIAFLIFLAGIFFIIGARYGSTKKDTGAFLTSRLNLHLLSSPIQTVGSDYLLYHLRCGSSCLGIQLVHIPNDKVYKGVISYMFDHAKQKDYALFTDWHGNDFRLDSLFNQATATIRENTVVLTFADTDRQTESQNITIDIE